MKNRKGFTLTELLAVIVIMAILAIAAISGYSVMTNNSKQKALESRISEIENSAIKYATERNLKRSETISVNKLVVEGYLQPDEATDLGLANISNPRTSENMICNLIHITISDNIFMAEYDEKNKDCIAAEQDATDMNINILAFKPDERDRNKIADSIPYASANVFEWTNTDVILKVSSPVYTDFDSISYDFDGQTVTKPKKNGPTDNNRYVEEDHDKIAIQDVKIMFNNEVTVTYNMKDGSVYSRTVVVRIDKEAPTVRAGEKGDVTTASTVKINLYLDDGNGSGLKGFQIKDKELDSSNMITNKDDAGSEEAGHGVLDGFNSYFYAEDKEYKVVVYDNAGNFVQYDGTITINSERRNTCKITVKEKDGSYTWEDGEKWYNKPITVTSKTTNRVGNMGLYYYYGILPIDGNITDPKKLRDFFDPSHAGGDRYLSTSLHQTTEENLRDYYMAMLGLSNANKEISHCRKTIGTDWTAPTVEFSCSDCGTYEKTHTVTITLTDDRSGFYDAAKSIQIGWSTSNTTAPTKWETISGGVKSNNGTIEDGKIVITTNLKGYTGDTPLTGDYYMWVRGTSFEDKAHNNAVNTPSPTPYKYDNTSPTCVSKGGDPNWRDTDLTINGECSDAHSGCVSDVSNTYTSDISFKQGAPGTVSDHAGNSTICPADQDVHIDKTAPGCTSTGGSDSWTNGSRTLVGTCTDGGSGCRAATVSRTLSQQMNSTTESPGTVYDNLGHSTACPNQTVRIDTTAPTCTNAQSGTVYLTGTSLSISGTCSDTGGSGCTATTFSVTANSTGTYTPGPVKDNAGNTGNCSSVSVIKDTTAPGCTTSGGNTSWTKKDVTIKGTCSDPESGCVSSTVTKKIDSGTHEKASPGDVCNNAGLCTTCPKVKVMVDQSKPSCTFSKGCSACPSPNNVTTYTAHCSDSGSGHSHGSSSWYIGTLVTPDYYNEPNGDDGANNWVEGLCSGNSSLSFSAKVCDKVGNCRSYSKTF